MKPPSRKITYRLGLIGYPLGHSLSPRLHQAALRAAGLQGFYELFPISADEVGMQRLRTLIHDLRAGLVDGLNVTIPHKQVVLALVDDLSPVARAVGAVNTLYVRDDRVMGDNTDVAGFLYDIKRLRPLPPGFALVLGAGGSARAVAYALAAEGWQVRVVARRQAQAETMVESLNRLPQVSGRLQVKEWIAAAMAGPGVDLVVNCTPLGMFPDVDGSPWPENLSLPPGAFVYDLVYNPPETRLISQARAQGLAAASGIGMLAAQAALAFGLWTGTDSPFDSMAAALQLQ